MSLAEWVKRRWVCPFIGFFWAIASLGVAQLTHKYEYRNAYFINYNSTIIQGLFAGIMWIWISKYKGELETTYTFRQLLPKAVFFSVLGFAANFMYYLSLMLTNPPSAMTLEQLTPLFIFFLSIWILKEKLTGWKLCSLLCCFGGAVAIVWADAGNASSSHPIIGDILSIGVALAAAVYMVLFKLWFANFTKKDLVFFFIAKAVATAALLWIPLIPLHFTGVERFNVPTWTQYGVMIAICLFSFGFNLSLMYVTITVAPVTARLSLLLGLPLVIVVNFVVFDGSLNWIRLIGILLVLVGVVSYEFLCERANKRSSYINVDGSASDTVYSAQESDSINQKGETSCTCEAS